MKATAAKGGVDDASLKFAKMTSKAPPSAAKDVMDFLENLDLDTGPPAKDAALKPPITSSGSSAQDVLSFLDELTVPPSSTAPKTLPTVATAPPLTSRTSMDTMPSAAHLFAGPPSATSNFTDVDEIKRAPQNPSPRRSKVEERQHEAQPLQEQQQQQQPPPQEGAPGGSWSWGTIWNTAQATASKVTASAATSITMAQSMVEDAAKVVTSEKVKGMVANVSKDVASSVSGVIKSDTVQRMRDEVTKSVTMVGDILAPPLGPDGVRELARRRSSVGLFAGSMSVWLCAQTVDPATTTKEEGAQTFDLVHDFVQSTANSLWIGPAGGVGGICTKVVVNGVYDPAPKSAGSLEEATALCEKTIERLEKLSETNKPQAAATAEPKAENAEVDVFLVIQPRAFVVSSEVLGETSHMQFLVLLLCPTPTGVEVVSSVTQSVRAGEAKGSVMSRWARDQASRVVETAITDVFEEFSLRCQLKE